MVVEKSVWWWWWGLGEVESESESERCHRGICVETCRIVVTKFCKCGSLKKQVKSGLVFSIVVNSDRYSE